MAGLTESVVEDAALAWLESLGYTVKHGSEIAPGEPEIGRAVYGQVVLEDHLRRAPGKPNSELLHEKIWKAGM